MGNAKNIPGKALLLPYQKAWVEDQSRLKIAEKSRRHCLEVLSLHEGVDIEQRSVIAQVQQLRATATPEEVEDGLKWLRSYGFAERRQLPLGGYKWRISEQGIKAHATL